MTGWVPQRLSAVRMRVRQRRDLLLEFIVLRHQLAVLQRAGTRRPCFRPSERLFWMFLSRWWVNWQRSLIIVQPATVLRWRRRGLWAIWVSGSCRRWRGGRPRISSEVRALIIRMSEENFLWGAPRIHGELMKLGFDVSQATVSRYMPRRSYPATQGWRTFLRNQAFAIGAIGLGEAGRPLDELLALVRGWIARVVPCATKVRDGIGKLVEPSSPLQPLRRHRSSNRTDWRDPPTTLGGDNWTMAGRRLSAYRSRASPRRKLPAFANFARPSLWRARAKRTTVPTRRCVLHVCHEQLAQQLMILDARPLPGDPSAAADKVVRHP
jgi:Homeodomain-like domain